MLRRTPIRRKRATPRRTDLTKAEKSAIRNKAYARAHGRCEIRADDMCLNSLFPGSTLPLEGHLFVRAHLVHLRNKRMFGWGEENICIGCYHCHIAMAHQGRIKLPKTYSELVGGRAA